MYTNYELSSPQHRELLQLNDILQGNVNLHYIEYCSSGISNRLKELIDHFITNNNDNPLYQLIISVDPYVKRQNRAAWTEAIKDGMNELGAEYLNSISLAFTERNTTVLFFKLNNTHVVITSQRLSGEQKYFLNLGAMLLDCKDDTDFVKRASEAIQNKTILTLSERELKLLIDAQHAQMLTTTKSIAQKLLMQDRPIQKIRQIQRDIATYTDVLNDLMSKLRELQIVDFGILTNENMNEEHKQELMEYLHSIRENILDASEDSDKQFTITVGSYMYIPETDKDFFKPEAIRHSGHILNGRSRIAKLLKDVMDLKVRLPIRATYRIIKHNENPHVRIRGTSFMSMNATYSSDKYVVNSHVDGYNCFNGYKNQMMEALHNGNIIGLFEIMLQCTSCITVFDNTVMLNIINSIDYLNGDTIIKYRTDNGWENMRLEDYYAKIENE